MNKKAINMRKNAESLYLLSRRSVIGSVAAGVGLSAMPRALLANTTEAAKVVATAFDGNSLFVAGQTLSRSEGSAPMETLPSPEGGAILTLATHPERPGRIFAGLASGGVSLSNDGGLTWEARGQNLPAGAVSATTVAAALPDTIYAAVRGDGLWRSEDAGISWEFVMDRPWLENAERDPLALASVDLETGMGGIWIYAGTEIGLTRVPDCFCRWQGVTPGDAMDALVSGDSPPPEFPLPAGEPILALVSAPSTPETLYAALPSGLWTSHDSGVVWSRLIGEAASAVAVQPTNANHIAAAFNSGLKQSRDGGVNWTAIAVA
jgi:hypothetical protein